MLPISLLNVSLKNKAFSSHNHNIIITPTKLSYYSWTSSNHQLWSIFPNDLKNVFSGFLFKSRPKPSPHTVFGCCVSSHQCHSGPWWVSGVLAPPLSCCCSSPACLALPSTTSCWVQGKLTQLRPSPPAPAQHGLCHRDPGTRRSLFSAVPFSEQT